jgi:hypothetical protein
MTTSDRVMVTARLAAERLAAEYGPELLADVEIALHRRGAEQLPGRYVIDPISLGSLIVAVATLAWNVYTDLHKRTPEPSPDVIARTIRVQISDTDATDSAQRDRIVDIVVSETVRAASALG